MKSFQFSVIGFQFLNRWVDGMDWMAGMDGVVEMGKM